jgi:hypothetical protein
MPGKIGIYCKQHEEGSIPLTVRIEWLPDGKIKPLIYWLPDGTCHRVLYHSSAVPISVLKDKGTGLRFDVRSEIIETAEPDSELLYNRYDTYLYLAHKRVCEKNIVDERYVHTGKEYIPVTLDIFPDGDYELVYFVVREKRYKVEKTIKIENHGSFRAGGIGVLHKVEARLVNADDDEDPDPQKSVRRQAAIYRELNKWFIYVANTAA